MANRTNSFSIAQYILLFGIAAACIGLVAWTMISAHRQSNNNTPVTVTHIQNDDPCVQEVINTVSKLWAYNSDMIPQKYWDMADAYANETITTKIRGACNEINFVCRVGQIRRDCDPCAVASGREIAREQQITDMIEINCKK